MPCIFHFQPSKRSPDKVFTPHPGTRSNQLRELSLQNKSTIVGVKADDGGHFLIVDSYKVIDNVGYYMIRDPYNGTMGVRADILESKLNHNGVFLK